MKRDVRGYRLPTSFFVNNRARLAKLLPERVVALFFSGRPPVMSADAHYPFFANRNFFYLTGLEIENAVWVLYKTPDNIRSTLYMVLPANPVAERWTGRCLRPDEAKELSGLTDIRPLSVIEDDLATMLRDDKLSVAYGKDVEPLIADDQVLKAACFDHRTTVDTQPMMATMRTVKASCEIDMMKRAIRLTFDAIDAIRLLIRPGATELSIHSAFLYELHRRGCYVPAFAPVIAAGEHTLYLHHPHPEGKLRDGDILQLDVGARIGGLCADISRVFSVGKAMSERQLALHNAVLRCQKVTFAAIRPGVTLEHIDEICRQAAQKELDMLGLFDTADATLSTYYWHRVSHHLGHDVHDVYRPNAVLEPGVVLTVEPGLYIPQWGVGMRIEDDVVVTADGCHVLSHLPQKQGGDA